VNDRKQLDVLAIGLMVLVCGIWALQPVGMKATAMDAAPVLQIGVRSGIAAVLVWILIRARGEHVRMSGGVWIAGLLAGLLFALEFLLVGESLKRTSASHVVVFLYTAPIFAALGLHRKIPSERLAAFQWFGVGLAATGVAVTFFGRGSTAATPVLSDMILGDVMALGAGMLWGAATIVIRTTALASIPAAHTLFYQLASASLLLVAAAVAMGQTQVELTTALLVNLAFQSVIVSFCSFLAWFWLLTQYRASQLGVFSFLTPMFGVLLGWALLDEPLNGEFVVGVGFMLAGIVLVSGYPWFRQMRARSAARLADNASASTDLPR